VKAVVLVVLVAVALLAVALLGVETLARPVGGWLLMADESTLFAPVAMKGVLW